MVVSKFMAAINQICDEKNLEPKVVLESVEAALAAAYKKDYGSREQEVRVELDPETGGAKVFVSKEVAAEVEDPYLQITKPEAVKIKKGAKIGDIIEVEDFPQDYGRIAAQTAKQVIIQRIREAERDAIVEEYKDKEGALVNGTVGRFEGRNVLVDLGKATGILFAAEQIPGERYYAGQRVKVLVKSVDAAGKLPQIALSRTAPEFVIALFELEVPEIPQGTVEIKAVAREAGSRTKIAVSSNNESVDPVGSCVGQRGTRVQAIQAELGDEKIDIIPWSEDEETFIKNALSPAKATDIKISKKAQEAKVFVPEGELSLAIGKAGQNVRLAVKLTGWKIDIEGVGGEEKEVKSKEEKSNFAKASLDKEKESNSAHDKAGASNFAKASRDKSLDKEEKAEAEKSKEKENKKSDEEKEGTRESGNQEIRETGKQEKDTEKNKKKN